MADARIHRLAAALTHDGLVLELLGLGDAALAPPGVATRVHRRPGPIGRALLALRFAAMGRGRVLLALDPDSLLASLVLARLRRRRVVADVHEDYTALLNDRPWAHGPKGRAAGVLARAATAAARRADLVVVADEHVPPLRAPHRLVLRNLPYLGMLPSPSEPEHPPRALYVGDIRASRGLWSMIEAIERAPGWVLDLVGPVSPADQAQLHRYLATGPARDRIRAHGRRPPREAWALARGASCGLVLLDDTPAFRAALPSKLYEYVASGLPVVVTDLPRQREFVEHWQVGAVVSPGPGRARELADVLVAWGGRDAAARAAAAERALAFGAEAQSWAAEYEAAADAVVALARPGISRASR